jgi:hypothetical protein
MSSTPPLETTSGWQDGSITSTTVEEWFTFTATSSTVYIHFSPGSSLNDVNVQLYDSAYNPVDDTYNCYGSQLYFSRSVTSGQTYHVRVWPYYSGSTGTYRIGFNTSSTPPSS